MHFTLCFDSSEGSDLSYGLLFVPCPVWQKGNEQLLNLNPENPDYQKGSVGKLLELESITERLAPGSKRAIVIIHDDGHGTEQYLQDLVADLVAEGFEVSEARFGD